MYTAKFYLLGATESINYSYNPYGLCKSRKKGRAVDKFIVLLKRVEFIWEFVAFKCLRLAEYRFDVRWLCLVMY